MANQQQDGLELEMRVQDVEAKLAARLEEARQQLGAKTKQVQELQEALKSQQRDNAVTLEKLKQTEDRVMVGTCL